MKSNHWRCRVIFVLLALGLLPFSASGQAKPGKPGTRDKPLTIGPQPAPDPMMPPLTVRV